MDTTNQEYLLTYLEQCKLKALGAYEYAQKLQDESVKEKLETIVSDVIGLTEYAKGKRKEASD
jgi:hypothetical protein